MRSGSLSRKVGMWPRSSLGKRFIRAKEFLRYLVFFQMPEALNIISSIYANERLENTPLDVVSSRTCLSNGTPEQLVM